MHKLYKESLSTRILEVVTRWNIISLADLQRAIQEQKNKDSIHRLTNSLIKKGLLQDQTIPVLKSKIILPTKKLIEASGVCSSSIKNSFIIHDTLLTSYCLDILNFKNVDEIFLEKDINGFERTPGELSPDAEGVVYFQNQPHKIAIEFEYTQKSKNRILNKFQLIGLNSSYSKVIFIFKNQREGNVYANIFIEYLNKQIDRGKSALVEKFIFCVRSDRQLPCGF